MSTEKSAAPRPSRAMPLAVAAAAVLVLASGGLFYYATISKQAAPADGATRVEIGASACTPNELALPAGRHVFEIHNASQRPVEWEILDGIMVIEERENILPGFRQRLTASLKPGTYEITCGLLSNPRGKLVVAATAASDAAATAGPDLKAFIGPLSEYKVFLVMQGSALVAATQDLVAAIRRGDVARARALYAPARAGYRAVAAVAGRWADLQNSIDPAADYLEKREQDAGFTGFHRIEYGLFAGNTTEGLQPAADRLLADVTTLKARLGAVKLAPDDLTQGAARLARRLADGRIERGENAYAHSDLADLDASLAGLAKMARLVRPLIPTAAADLAKQLDGRVDAVRQALAALKSGDVYPSYERVDAAGRRALAGDFRDLADTLDTVSARLSPG